MSIYHFYDFVLLDDEQKAFDKFKKKNQSALSSDEYALLIKSGLIEEENLVLSESPLSGDSAGIYSLSDKGERLRQFQKEQRRIVRINSFRFWFPAILSFVSLALSVISFFVAGLTVIDARIAP